MWTRVDQLTYGEIQESTHNVRHRLSFEQSMGDNVLFFDGRPLLKFVIDTRYGWDNYYYVDYLTAAYLRGVLCG